MITKKIQNWLDFKRRESLFRKAVREGLSNEYIEKQKERIKKAEYFEKYFNKAS